MRSRNLIVERTVDGDAQEVADLLNLAARQAEGSEIPENEVVVGAVGLKLVAMANELISQSPCIGNDLLGILLPGRICNLLEGGGNGGDGLLVHQVSTARLSSLADDTHVVVGSTLAGREDGLVNTLLEVLCIFEIPSEEDQASPRTTESLVPIIIHVGPISCQIFKIFN